MKNIILFISILIFTATSINVSASGGQTEKFKVWGNCGMCEKIIEKSLKTKGISSAEWNKDTKMITVVFNPKKISLSAIHKKIASVGYDTELETASDEVYNNLHGCCQYERKNN